MEVVYIKMKPVMHELHGSLWRKQASCTLQTDLAFIEKYSFKTTESSGEAAFSEVNQDSNNVVPDLSLIPPESKLNFQVQCV